ncbi:hypothetical protein B0I18_105148 [Taibaiella chishuiensis]|uniref:Uncharacterized protein n=2 Tax=Taibaiella chishuiensis TaxID=1434707 RepID=A0A2P8D2Y6_9BACT|nr:hypothetical protein B0I18_105148 [Taibaiella chishuiensis]
MEMKKILYASLALLLMATGCTKTSPSDGDSDNADDLLTEPATGWKRVAIIPFDGLGGGATPYNAMKGFDLQKANGQFAVLYTQHSLEPVAHVSSDYFYKTVVSENATATNLQKISFGIFSGGGNSSPFTWYGQLLPNSVIPVFTGMDYNNNYIQLRNSTGDIIAGAPASNYPTFKYTNDGTFLAGSMWTGHESFLWHYKNPPDPIGDFSATYRPGVIEGHKRLFNIPVKAADGNYYEFSLCSKDGATTFMVIRCREDRTYGATPPNYEIVDAGTVANMPQSGFPADFLELLTYDYNTETGEITFVFDDFQSAASGSDARKNIYCYRWRQGSLTRLWQASLDQDADFSNAVKVYINKNMLNEWRLKPDGTLYTMARFEANVPQPADPAIKLWEVNNSGVKVISSITYGQTVQKDFTLSTCRYLDGAYYALAYPTGDGRYRIGDPHYHMEIVKLNP